MMASERASKKQKELLSFVDNFIKGNGYGPSYREIMRSLDYKSVSTVAIHIDNLITKGYLRKRDHSARSLEVISLNQPQVQPDLTPHIDWLKAQIRQHQEAGKLDEASTLESALKILIPNEDTD